MEFAMNSSTTYADMAAIIAPTSTPTWATTLLSDWVSSLALDRGVHANRTATAVRNG